MEMFNWQMERTIDSLYSLLDRADDNVKEYFMECGLWDDDYCPLFNILGILEAHIKERFL